MKASTHRIGLSALRGAGVGAALLALSAAAAAQTPVGPVITVAGGAQPAVAMDAAGQSVVVWLGSDADGAGIFARRLDVLGNPAGDAFPVNESVTGWQSDPKLAIGPGGDFVVVWSSQTAAGTHVVFRRFDLAGTALGGDVQADVDPTQQALARSVAIDPTGTILVVWDSRPGRGLSDVLARRFNPAGAPLGDPFRVSSATTGNPGVAGAAPLRGGGFVVAWNRDMRTSFGELYEAGTLAARGFDADGSPRGDEFAVRADTATFNHARTRVVAEPDGGFLVHWGYPDANEESRSARSFDAARGAREAEFKVAALGGYEYDGIRDFAAGPPGGFVVVGDRWTYVNEDEGIDHHVHARRVNAAGNQLEPTFVVGLGYSRDTARAAANEAGDFIVVWTVGLYGNTILARKYRWDPTGRLTGRVVDGTSGLAVPGADVRAGRFNGHTDAAGVYSILLLPGGYSASVEIVGYVSDTVPVTVSGGGVTPQDFVVWPIPALRVAGAAVEDGSGNANGIADVNECFGLRIDLSNVGAGAATGVSATLLTTTAGATVQQAGSSYPDVPAGGTAVNRVPFAIKTSPTFVPGTVIQLSLTVVTAEGRFTLPVSVPTAAVKRQAFDAPAPVRVLHFSGSPTILEIPVTGVQGVITRVQVRVHVTRAMRGTMRLYLAGPDGTEATLTNSQERSFGFGTDCPASSNDVTFEDGPAKSLDTSRPPYVGEYRPFTPLTVFAGKSGAAANGVWKIRADDINDDTSVIQCARVLITYHAARSGECAEVAIAGTVTRSDTGAPVAGASVRTDTAFQTVTDAEGRYRLAVTPGRHRIEVGAAGHSPGRAEATAVAGATVTADVALAPVVLTVSSVAVDDTGPGGNANGRVDFDEAFRLSVTLSNAGGEAGATSATLRPVSPGVAVARGVSGYPALPAGGSATNVTPFELRTTPSFQHTGAPLRMTLTLAVGGSLVDVPLSVETGTPGASATATFAGTAVVNVSGLAGPIAKVVAQTYAETTLSGYVTLWLEAPDQTRVELKDHAFTYEAPNIGTSCPAADDDLTLDDDASTGIWYANWPWRGRFRPTEPLARFNGKGGAAANGRWIFQIASPNPYAQARVPCGRLHIDTFASAGADAADLVFRDGFDGPEPFAAWSQVGNDGDLSATTAAALTPTVRGMQAVVDDRSGLFVRHEVPGGEDRYRARFHFDPNGFDPGEAGGKRRATIFLAFADGPQRRLIQLVLRRLNGAYSLRGVVRLDDDALAETPFAPITDAPHVLELAWRRASAPDAADGAFELWIDGGLAGRLDGLDNDSRAVDFIRLGAMTLKDGAMGTLYFDQYEARRALPIGPYVH